jgi:hypothetical protein
MAEPQLARVVKVIDPYTVVINKGRKDGVHWQNSFLVFELGEELTDPETGEDLGKLEIVKGQGEVKHLQDTITTVRSSTTRKQHRSIVLPGQDEYSEVLNEFEEPKVGDLVRIK